MYQIKYLDDVHDCEVCGYNYASGYLIHKDGVLIVDRTPVASCYSSVDFSSCNPYYDILMIECPDVQVATELAVDDEECELE